MEINASFIPSAKPSDLGTLSVVLFLLLVVGFGYPEVCSKVARFFLSSQNPNNTFKRCVQELPYFINPPPKKHFQGCVQRGVQRGVLNTPLEMLLRK